MKIIAGIITHNRSELLVRCLENVLNQTRKLDKILIIDNGSTDNTSEILKNYNIDYIYQENNGSAAGWNKAIELALNKKFDLIWLMDDDGFPALNSLEILEKNFSNEFSCLSSVAVDENKHNLFTFPYPHLNLYNVPVIFKLKRKFKYLDDLTSNSKNFLYNYANLFNGALISMEAVKKIGNVNKDFFIYGEEVDFFYRLRDYGKVYSYIKSIHYHPNVNRRPLNQIKIYYFIKNTLILNKKYFNIYLIRNILTVGVILYRILIRNGVIDFLNYTFGKKNKIIILAIKNAIYNKIEKDFIAKY